MLNLISNVYFDSFLISVHADSIWSPSHKFIYNIVFQRLPGKKKTIESK